MGSPLRRLSRRPQPRVAARVTPPLAAIVVIAAPVSPGCRDSSSGLDERPRLITSQQVHAAMVEGSVIAAEIDGEITLAGGYKAPFRFEMTTKGNGTLRIANLELGVYDAHDDGSFFEPYLLDLALNTTHGECTSIEVTGIQVLTGDVHTAPLRRRRILYRCVYDSELRTFSVQGEHLGTVRTR